MSSSEKRLPQGRKKNTLANADGVTTPLQRSQRGGGHEELVLLILYSIISLFTFMLPLSAFIRLSQIPFEALHLSDVVTPALFWLAPLLSLSGAFYIAYKAPWLSKTKNILCIVLGMVIFFCLLLATIELQKLRKFF